MGKKLENVKIAARNEVLVMSSLEHIISKPGEKTASKYKI